MSSSVQEKSAYWERYYSTGESGLIAPPSQFAAFIAQEIEGDALLIDVGCGSGRDSIFFAQRGLQVIGLDAANAAIETCQDWAVKLDLPNASFQVVSVADDTFGTAVEEAVSSAEKPVVVYARFFLHAITEQEQGQMLAAVAEALRPGDLLAVEYRTTKDAMLAKETAAHYRRYIDPTTLVLDVAARGFVVEYAAEGFGFAKYRHDDAHVARVIARKK